MKFARPCLSCGERTRDGNRCEPCRLEYQREFQSGIRKPYADKAWRKLSAEVRSERPWCEMCGASDNLTVDHILPLSKGGELIVPRNELRVLCRRCHGKITQH
jgi:5-methylcytosine-specific restriction protein A